MRKYLEKKMAFLPLPVVIIGTYDKENRPNAINAAWASQYDFNEVVISLSKHKTTENLEINKEFTVSFATKSTLEISDYFGIASGNNEDKIKKANVSISKARSVNAPIILEYPLTLECKVKSFIDGILIGEVVDISVDSDYLNKDWSINVDKMEIITFDSLSNSYRVLGEKVGCAFKDGLKIKDRG